MDNHRSRFPGIHSVHFVHCEPARISATTKIFALLGPFALSPFRGSLRLVSNQIRRHSEILL